MPSKRNQRLKSIYNLWKSTKNISFAIHPTEEDLACFIEGRIPERESDLIKEHLILCRECAEKIALALKLKISKKVLLPSFLLKPIVFLKNDNREKKFLELFIKIKGETLELIRASAKSREKRYSTPALLFRNIRPESFKNQLTILKHFANLLLEIKIFREKKDQLNLTLILKKPISSKLMRQIRIELIKDGRELESKLCTSGKLNFLHLQPGEYTLDIYKYRNKIGNIRINIIHEAG